MPGVTDRQFYEEMQKIREHIDRRANELEAKLEKHAEEDRLVAADVSTIKTERRLEAGQTKRRMSLMVFIGGAGMTGLWKLLDHLWKP